MLPFLENVWGRFLPPFRTSSSTPSLQLKSNFWKKLALANLYFHFPILKDISRAGIQIFQVIWNERRARFHIFGLRDPSLVEPSPHFSGLVMESVFEVAFTVHKGNQSAIDKQLMFLFPCFKIYLYLVGVFCWYGPRGSGPVGTPPNPVVQ